MPDKAQKIGWIGMGRMGFPMAERLLKAGYDVSIWNRTRAKAEPLAKSGGRIVDKPSDLAGVDVLFAIVSTGPAVGPRAAYRSGRFRPSCQVPTPPRDDPRRTILRRSMR